jgi:hypothetical protein
VMGMGSGNIRHQVGGGRETGNGQTP